MIRIPEPDLMEGEEQIKDWVSADREFGIRFFFNKFVEKFPNFKNGRVADLGCGVADYSGRLKENFPDINIVGYDASEVMLRYAASMNPGIRLEKLKIPSEIREQFDLTMSVHLLHHLENPNDLWKTIREITKSNGKAFVMDLIRPTDTRTVDYIIDTYAKNQPKLYKEDFERSLYAAYTVEEVKTQLTSMDLSLEIDIHFDDQKSLGSMIIYGNI